MAQLPIELWLQGGNYLSAEDQVKFFGAHPKNLLAKETRAATMLSAIRKSTSFAVVAGILESAQDLPDHLRARVLTQVVRWSCLKLGDCTGCPSELPAQQLLDICLDRADALPLRLSRRVLSTLLLRLPHPYCDRQSFVKSRHGVFATRVITGVLAAASGGDGVACRAVGRSGRNLTRWIDLEHGVAPGLKHETERAARATQFMRILARPETIALGNADSALVTVTALLSCYLLKVSSHLPLLQQLVGTPGKTDSILGLQYLSEMLDRVPDPDDRTELMCDMIKSAASSGKAGGGQAVTDSVQSIATHLKPLVDALEPRQHAAVNEALRAAGYTGQPL